MASQYQLPYLILLMVSLLGQSRATCSSSSNQVECGNSNQCIRVQQVCDGTKNCDDGTDELEELCKINWNFPVNVHNCNYDRPVYCSYNCRNHRYACGDQCGRGFTEACQIINKGKLPEKKAAGMNMTTEAEQQLTSAVNSTLNVKNRSCPMLYIPLDGECFAFFSLAAVSWPEARQFCKSIYGDLVSFKSIERFGGLVNYLLETELTTDFWLGGRYEMDVNAWAWVSDDKPMPLGSPYWASRYSSSCVPRSPPHTDPFSPPPQALPGAPCFHYLQAPKQRQQGWCSAITYEHYYLLTDENCQEPRSPLCILTHTPYTGEEPVVIP